MSITPLGRTHISFVKRSDQEIIRSLAPRRDASAYEPRTQKQEPILNAVVFFDTQSADFNGVMTQQVRDALVSEVPLFCPVALLQGIAIDPSFEFLAEEIPAAREEIEYLLKNEAENWDFYVDRQHGGELVVIPKSYFGAYSGSEKLELLGINPESVVQVAADTLLKKEPFPQVAIEDFLSMFHSHSQTRLRLFLSGHGDASGQIGGLKAEDYQKFLDFFAGLPCDALFIDSCHAGGVNRKHQKAVKFPIIVFSIGNFPTRYQQEDLKAFFRKVDASLVPRSTVTKELFSRLFHRNQEHTHWENLAQVRLPGEKEFHLLNEDGSSLVLTQENSSKPSLKLSVDKRRIVALFARKISTPIDFGDSAPFILSTRLENPTHVVAKAHSKLTLDAFFETTKERLTKFKTQYQKIVFNHLECRDGIYKQVVLTKSEGKWQLFARDKEKGKYLHFPYFELFGAIHPTIITKGKFTKMRFKAS